MAISPVSGARKQPALPFDLDAGVAVRAAIGLIVLSSDQTIEHEFRTLLGLDGVALYQSRIRNDSRITPETLMAMEERITEATDVILPGMPLDVVAFACTSASMVIGEERVFERIKEARPNAIPTTPITAVFAALEAFRGQADRAPDPLSGRRQPGNPRLCRGPRRRGPGDGLVRGGGRSPRLPDQRGLDQESAAIALGRDPSVEAVFVSCTSLRLAGVVEEIEAVLAKSVTSSNHALAWHCLRLAGIDDRLENAGRLYQLDLPPGHVQEDP